MELALVGNEQLVIDGLNEEAIAEWIEYREDKKKPLSKLALKKTQNLLLKHDHAQQQLMVDTAVMNDWQGIHVVDPPKQNTTRERSLSQDLNDKSWAGL
jgi:hypothetical protein